jgi:hypothetical protein
VFGSERVDWRRLAAATQIATLSHDMRRCMGYLGADPIVIPNGLSDRLIPRRWRRCGVRPRAARCSPRWRAGTPTRAGDRCAPPAPHRSASKPGQARGYPPRSDAPPRSASTRARARGFKHLITIAGRRLDGGQWRI